MARGAGDCRPGRDYADLSLKSIGKHRSMDKKAKKKVEVLRKRIEKMQILLQCAKEQMDDPSEVEQLQSDIEQAKAEITRLKAS